MMKLIIHYGIQLILEVSAFYGAVIENMPVTEAIPDQTKALKFRLLSLPGNNSTIYTKSKQLRHAAAYFSIAGSWRNNNI